jgi:hypothetical protein
MSYIVFCTFDLKNASSADYQNAYADLQKLGLTKVHTNAAGGNSVIPTTSVMGVWNGANAAAIRDDVRAKAQAAFTIRRFKSEIFVVVGGQDWGWAAGTS